MTFKYLTLTITSMDTLRICFKLTVIVFLAVINIQCNKNRFKNVGPPGDTPPQTQTQPVNQAVCDFYKIETLLLNCYEKYSFFTQITQERRNIIASACFKHAFVSVWGVNFNPSPYIYDPEAVQNTNFHWRFSWGNIQKGSPSAFLPNSLELKYQSLLNQFLHSLDTAQMNQCLGGNYPFVGPTIISTSYKMISLKMLEPETFINCYRTRLETYGLQNNCSFN